MRILCIEHEIAGITMAGCPMLCLAYCQHYFLLFLMLACYINKQTEKKPAVSFFLIF